MSVRPDMRASDVAARQVERIVGAAQEAAEQLRMQVGVELEDLRHEAERETEQIREQTLAEMQREQEAARKEAILLTQHARHDAEGILADANAESTQIRERTQRAMQGRVAAAERAASEVLADARALSGGLRQLGRLLEEQAARILRDVEAAHKQMQGDLRIGGASLRDGPDAAAPSPREEGEQRDGPSPGARPAGARSRRGNPFDDLEVPSWE